MSITELDRISMQVAFIGKKISNVLIVLNDRVYSRYMLGFKLTKLFR